MAEVVYRIEHLGIIPRDYAHISVFDDCEEACRGAFILAEKFKIDVDVIKVEVVKKYRINIVEEE